ncbi:MAG: class I SAM-dependent methyltransferase [Pseudomonadota bacterium]
MTEKQCGICGSGDVRSLPAPAGGAMISDGALLPQTLDKLHCNSCGSLTTLNQFTLNSYHRSNGLSDWEKARHEDIAAGLKTVIRGQNTSQDLAILEVGAGNFATSAALKRLCPDYLITAIEPYPENEKRPDGITCIAAGLAAYEPTSMFDVVVSNQVIEHVDDPLTFLETQQRLLKPGGRILVCCPAQTSVSNELMFVDHLWHFTAAGFAALISRSRDLALCDAFLAPWDPLTQVFILRRDGCSGFAPPQMNIDALFEERSHLMAWWSARERAILATLGHTELISIFGAGELTQLLRAYMPGLYDRVQHLVVTQRDGCRQFEEPIILLQEALDTDDKMLIGVRPQAHDKVREMLLHQGVVPSRIIDLYSH